MSDNIFEKLKRSDFSPATVREIIQSAYAEKISRIFLEDEQLHYLAPVLDELGLDYFLSPKKYIFNQDVGKGGFSNSIRKLVPTTSPNGAFMVHIGKRKEKLLYAREIDLNGDDYALGQALGIPECCIKAFVQNTTEAFADQNDYTLFTVGKQNLEPDPWSVHCAQYFGYGLVSHFPCSVNCKKTSVMAKAAAKLLNNVEPNLALDFIRYQGYCYLYTEYDGIYAFKETGLIKHNIWHYDPKKIEMSNTGLLAQAIIKGNQLIINFPSDFKICNEEEEIMKVQSESVCVLFHTKSVEVH